MALKGVKRLDCLLKCMMAFSLHLSGRRLQIGGGGAFELLSWDGADGIKSILQRRANTFLFWQSRQARDTLLRLRNSDVLASQTDCILFHFIFNLMFGEVSVFASNGLRPFRPR
jgi:hypothetical protein